MRVNSPRLSTTKEFTATLRSVLIIGDCVFTDIDIRMVSAGFKLHETDYVHTDDIFLIDIPMFF